MSRTNGGGYQHDVYRAAMQRPIQNRISNQKKEVEDLKGRQPSAYLPSAVSECITLFAVRPASWGPE